jgi:hypothetical protein
MRREFWICLALLGFLLQPLLAQTPKKDLCSLFTTTEIGTLLGAAVEAGEPAGLLTTAPGCQWFGKDEKSYVVVQVTARDNWMNPTEAPGYQAIPNAGKQAYSHRDLEGGWRGMALVGNQVVVAQMIGASAQQANLVTLIRRTIQRL